VLWFRVHLGDDIEEFIVAVLTQFPEQHSAQVVLLDVVPATSADAMNTYAPSLARRGVAINCHKRIAERIERERKADVAHEFRGNWDINWLD
jgi:hypothetical protein